MVISGDQRNECAWLALAVGGSLEVAGDQGAIYNLTPSNDLCSQCHVM